MRARRRGPGAGPWVLAGLLLAGGGRLAAEPDRLAAEPDRLALGLAAYRQGDARQAVEHFEQALQAFTRAGGERHPATLRAMQYLAVALGALGRTAEQLALNEKALRLRTEVLGERHPDTLTSMNNLAATYSELGRSAEQLALMERVRALRIEVLGPRHPDTLVATANLAATYGALGRHAERFALNEAVFQQFMALYGERHPDTLRAMANLAVDHGDLGRGTEQLALSEKVLRLRTELLGEHHPDTLQALSLVAFSLGAVGRSAEQLALTETVLQRRAERLGERHPDTLRAMTGLAAAYTALGRTAEALALHEKVLSLRTETLGERHPDTLGALNNLASTYGTLGRRDEQLRLNERVLQLVTETQGERHPHTLTSMSNLASTYGALGRNAEQLALNEKVLRLRTETLGERHPSTLGSMNNLAQSHLALGQSAEAVALHERALRLYAQVQGEQHPDTLVSMGNLAWSYVVARRQAVAARFSPLYVAGAERLRSQPGLSGESRRSLFEGFASNYRLFSLVHGGLGQLPEGFHLSELGKARTLLEAMAQQRAGRAGVLPPEEQARLEALNRQGAALDQRIAQTRQPEARAALEAERNELARSFEALQAELQARHPKYAQLRDVRLLGAEELPGLVDADAVAVSYVHLPATQELGAFVVDADGLRRFVALGRAPGLADAVEIVRLGLSTDQPLRQVLQAEGRRAWRLAQGGFRLLPAEQPAPRAARELQDSAEVVQFLATLLLDPLARELGRKPHWLIAPDGPLARLPFEALPFGERGEPALAAARIHYTQSLSVHALGRALQRQYAALEGRRSLFAMGNPVYPGAAAGAPPARGVRLARGQALSELNGRWHPLPGTEAEVRGVAALFPGSATVHLGPNATERQLQALNAQGALRQYRQLLFSAHGYLAPDEPALSALVLGLQDTTPEADGYVTAAEWPTYDLRSDLTVLSACDSGIGRLVHGEGVMGLPYALFVAGNVNTILTLWPVDDEATAEFVRTLFAHIQQGRSASQALTETKRAFRSHARFAHPSYWAPFILVGAG